MLLHFDNDAEKQKQTTEKQLHEDQHTTCNKNKPGAAGGILNLSMSARPSPGSKETSLETWFTTSVGEALLSNIQWKG